jgi:integrase
MQHGCMERLNRKRGPEVWQFRWSVTSPEGKRLYQKKIVGTVERYPDENTARLAVVGLISEINSHDGSEQSRRMTVAQLCDHFEQRELTKENTWRSHATKKIYKAYLTRWIRPHWQKHQLAEVRTIQVEAWLRSLAFGEEQLRQNPKCDVRSFQSRLPIRAVRPQSDLSRSSECKRRRAPTVLMPAEIKALVDNLSIRERTLVILAASTGLRQSEMFGLKWEDIDFTQGNMSVTRSIVYGVVGSCKTESSQKPVPIHPLLADALLEWRKHARYTAADDWVFASTRYRGRRPYWGQAILRKYIRTVALRVGVQKRFGWHTFRHTYSTLLRSVGTEFKVIQLCDPRWTFTRRRSLRPSMQRKRRSCRCSFLPIAAADRPLHGRTPFPDSRKKGDKRGAKCALFAPSMVSANSA